MVDEPISFIERRRKFLEEKARKEGKPSPFDPPPPTPQPEFKQEDIPDVIPERSEEDQEMDRIIDSIGIVEAYNKWCGKSTPEIGKKREGIKVSCPNPQHPDRDPSAWLNLDKNTWFCGGCQEGGDTYDIAAFHFGFPVPGYKEGQTFHKLREQMAESFGYQIKRLAGNQKVIIPPVDDESPVGEQMSESPQNEGLDTGDKVRSSSSSSALSPEKSSPPNSDTSDQSGSVATVTSIDPADDDEPVVQYPTIDWRSIVTPDTFLWKYLEACSNDDSPEEYHFWHGLLALGHAVGRNVSLSDDPNVLANLLLCILGGTGVGKSRSRRHLSKVVETVMPFRETGMNTTGVKVPTVSGSGEKLIEAFSYEGHDPTNAKISLGFQTVNGIANYSEFSQLITTANRQSSILKNVIMDMADGYGTVSTGSRTHGDTIAKDPFCSITSSTQPRAIRSLLSRVDADSGFVNRWVFAGGKPKERIYFGGVHSGTVIDLDPAIEELKLVRGYGGVERHLRLDEDALVEATLFMKHKVEPALENDETQLLQRLTLLFKKLYLIFAINERRTETITLDIVKRVNLLFDYLVECYAIVNENIGITQSIDIQNEILRHIKRHTEKFKKGPTAADLVRYCKRKNWSLEHISKSLDVMEKLGLIETVRPKSNMGRPTIRFQAVGE